MLVHASHGEPKHVLAQLPSLVCQLLAFDSHLLVRLNV